MQMPCFFNKQFFIVVMFVGLHKKRDMGETSTLKPAPTKGRETSPAQLSQYDTI